MEKARMFLDSTRDYVPQFDCCLKLPQIDHHNTGQLELASMFMDDATAITDPSVYIGIVFVIHSILNWFVNKRCCDFFYSFFYFHFDEFWSKTLVFWQNRSRSQSGGCHCSGPLKGAFGARAPICVFCVSGYLEELTHAWVEAVIFWTRSFPRPV